MTEPVRETTEHVLRKEALRLAREEERARIVAWLRKIGQPPMTEAERERYFRIYQRHPPQDPCRAIADAIERGMHAE